VSPEQSSRKWHRQYGGFSQFLVVSSLVFGVWKLVFTAGQEQEKEQDQEQETSCAS
jgi:hypothetical protein